MRSDDNGEEEGVTNGEWLRGKLNNFKAHIQQHLRPEAEWTADTRRNVEYVMGMDLDDWLAFASKHLLRYRDDPSAATSEICELYGLECAPPEAKHKITRYVELFIEVLN
jgi:hypothetical protein